MTALAAASVGVGSASAATQGTARTRAQWQAAIAQVAQPGTGCYNASYPVLRWHAVKCRVAPKFPLAPALRGPDTVGNGVDYSAQVSGLISKATGTFKNVTKNITEKGQVGGSGSKIANAFSLQLNTQFFSGSPACAGSSNPSNCLAWQQFVYAGQSGGVGQIFMQYWLINYNNSCPSGWFSFPPDCYTNSAAANLSSPLTAKQLATLKLSGSATAGGKDKITLTVGGHSTLVSARDSKIHLAAAWNTTEWGVFGDGGGGEAFFGTNTTLEAETALTATSSSAPTCVKEGFTAETNNLKLASTPSLGSQPSPTIGSKQTNGTSGTASCATAS